MTLLPAFLLVLFYATCMLNGGYGSLLINNTLSTVLSVNDLADVLGGELVLHRICGLTNNRAAPRKLNAFRAVFSNYRTCPTFGGHFTGCRTSVFPQYLPYSYPASYIATTFSAGLTAWMLWHGARM